MAELEYGKDYEYAHDTEENLTTMECLPESMLGTVYYRPTEQGSEKAVSEKLRVVKEWKRKHTDDHTEK